ncbi:MAG: Cof-type HAD-IIB family hydrolase [Eubacterium sp.]|nr:Cof-type HAD-IIB family hydrolase [Eubacterium sp.]
MNIKLLALDMDGTTLGSDISVAQETKAAISEAVASGVIVVPTTGRVLQELPEEITDLSGIDYAITSNGARVTDMCRNKSIYTNPLSKAELKRILEIFEDFDLMLDAYVEGKTMVTKYSLDHLAEYNVPRQYWDFFHETRKPVADASAYKDYLLTHEVEKFNIFFRNMADRERLAAVLTQQTKLTITSAVENNLEINNPTANKADGLKQLCQVLGIKPQEVMAVGDSNNDYDMLSYAGLAVAMANGIDRVKAIADFVTKSNDEFGVAWAIDKYILKNEAQRAQAS